MRGFFISSVNFANQGVTPGQGPQLTKATAGDQLVFTTRVYNYSLASMPPGSNVYVRFYGTLWNQATNQPLGKSFQIGNDVKVSPIPPFSATPGDPLNWVLASSDKFDTTPYESKYLAFFVVAWAQDASGALLQEMTGHGLNALPGEINSFADAVALEEVVNDALSGKILSYSNNIGFYNATFFVLPPKTVGVEPAPGAVQVGKVRVSRKSAKQGGAITISTLIKSSKKQKQAVSDLFAEFHHGDPKTGGRIFDMERVPFIKAGGSYQVKVKFRPSDCGRRRIYVTVGRGKAYEVGSKSDMVRIQCPRTKPRKQ
jgi:hypothetical protein